ncbi:MAG: aconitate hydratase, partial [Candidatus Lokiarchaeota archaeon]|nr:aconitate hydratase [Candidatus Lokiarchaeota archaeon]
APKYLGVKAVISKSFARMHFDNLVNFGIVPLNFKNSQDYESIEEGDNIEIELKDFTFENLELKNNTKNVFIPLTHNLSERQILILKAGGKLPYIKNKQF